VSDARTARRRTPPVELAALTRALRRGELLRPVAELATSGVSWREVEVEVEHGDPDLLDLVERRLLAAGVRRWDARSTLARVLGERVPAPAPAPRLGRKATAGASRTGSSSPT
jgi:hypothetical protein